MTPQQLQLILFAEQMAALAAKTIVDLKNVLTGNSAKTIDNILDDADSEYASIIATAKTPIPPAQ